MKKWESVILAAVIMLGVWSVVPFSASAAQTDIASAAVESGTSVLCTWTLDDDGVLTISGKGRMPDYWEGAEEFRKAPWNREDHPAVKKVIINEGITHIGNRSFSGCTELESVVIPHSVTDIGKDAFYYCTNLTSVTIPDSVTRIGEWAFNDCEKLAELDIPDSVTAIGNYAFGSTAWYKSQPNGLVYAGSVAYKYKGTCPESVTLREGTRGIAEEAFYNCTNLVNISIPDSVEEVGTNAFYGTKWYTSRPAGLVYVGKNLYSVKGNNYPANIAVLSGTKSISGKAFYGCNNLVSIEIPSGVTSIGGSAFYGCTKLESVTLPDSVTFIGDSAFYNCKSITDIDIPDGMTHIGSIFMYCSALRRVTIPDSVTSIGGNYEGSGSFFECIHLESVTIPDSVVTIGCYAFKGCKYMKDLVISDSVTFIGRDAFSGCQYLTSLTIPDSVTCIESNAFSGCYSVEQVDLGSSVQSIGDFAFYDIGLREGVTIPESVTSIGIFAFGYYYSSGYSSGRCKYENFTIYGSAGTDAERYANENAFAFKSADEIPENKPGDADGDGEITSVDVTVVRRYCALMKTGIDEATLMNADVDKNGLLEIIDATYIQRHLAGMEIPYQIG